VHRFDRNDALEWFVFLKPLPPPYDPLEWTKKPFAEKSRLVCNAWAMQGYGTPIGVYLIYAFKVALYVGGWFFFCGFTSGMGSLANVGAWWLEPTAFQKAIMWSMLFEITGLGCGSGPLTGRYVPPIGGALYFLRPGTTKLPAFEGAPLIGAPRRGWLDVLLYCSFYAPCKGSVPSRRASFAASWSSRSRSAAARSLPPTPFVFGFASVVPAAAAWDFGSNSLPTSSTCATSALSPLRYPIRSSRV